MSLNDPLIVIALFTTVCGLLTYLHKEGVDVLKAIKKGQDELKNQISELTASTIVHNEKLEQGAKEFVRIEEHQRTQDEKIDKIRLDLHGIKNVMLTHEHIKELTK